MGQTTYDVWEFLGLDKIPSCLATSNNNDSTGNKLESRIRIDINPRTTSFQLCMLGPDCAYAQSGLSIYSLSIISRHNLFKNLNSACLAHFLSVGCIGIEVSVCDLL